MTTSSRNHRFALVTLVEFSEAAPAEITTVATAQIGYDFDALRAILRTHANRIFGREDKTWNFERTGSMWPLRARSKTGRILEAK